LQHQYSAQEKSESKNISYKMAAKFEAKGMLRRDREKSGAVLRKYICSSHFKLSNTTDQSGATLSPISY
jgi:hypothetical protein